MTLSKGGLEVLKKVQTGSHSVPYTSASFSFYRRNRGIYRDLATAGLLKLTRRSASTRGLFIDTWEITDAGLWALGVEAGLCAPAGVGEAEAKMTLPTAKVKAAEMKEFRVKVVGDSELILNAPPKTWSVDCYYPIPPRLKRKKP